MVDSVLLLVDAVEGPMPQTRFVTQKAFAQGLNPIVHVNKIDRQGARPNWVIDEALELLTTGANDNQLDFPVIYASALRGTSGLEPDKQQNGMDAIFSMIAESRLNVSTRNCSRCRSAHLTMTVTLALWSCRISHGEATGINRLLLLIGEGIQGKNTS